MVSLALFPCSFTDGAGIIGELAASLHLRVYTDEMLFAEVADQFGIPVDRLKERLFRTGRDLSRYRLEKNKSIDLLRCALEARRLTCRGRCIFYGLHTSLLDAGRDPLLKLLVFDRPADRIRRAIQQEGISEPAARQLVASHDGKAATWTRFLFGKQPYDRSLYDLVISCHDRDYLEVTEEIREWYYHCEWLLGPTQNRPTGSPANHPVAEAA